MSDSFLDRVGELPHLGLGVSAEYGAGAAPRALDPSALREAYPAYAQFLEIGVEVRVGIDRDARSWCERRLPCTYHFLDVNLEDPGDLDDRWLADLRALVEALEPAWLCGDAGLWHFGRREHGHTLLLPPILSDDGASVQAEGISLMRTATGHEVLPENPPGCAFVGDLHILDYFARCCERADTGMLLDCAHLALYQRMMGHHPLAGLDGFPLDRVVEMHVAGSRRREHLGYPYFEDDHGTDVLDETWQIFEHVATGARHLRAVVFECERNPIAECLAGFERIARTLREYSGWP